MKAQVSASTRVFDQYRPPSTADRFCDSDHPRAVCPVDPGDAKRGHEQRGRRLWLVISIEQNLVHVDTVLVRRLYALVMIEHGTRRAHLAGITANSDGAW